MIQQHLPAQCPSAPVTTQDLLAAAVEYWDNTSVSEHYIQAALHQDSRLEVLISAYRYYFYKSNVTKALEIVLAVCDRLRQAEQWPTHWDDLQPLLQAQLEWPTTRLYVSAYAASGMLYARLGQIHIAQTIAEQIQQLQAKEFGADVLLGILTAPLDDDED